MNGFSVEIDLKEDIDETFFININSFAKVREFWSLGAPYIKRVSLCDLFDGDSQVFNEVMKSSTFPEGCPIPKVSSN